MVAIDDKTTATFIPLSGVAEDGWSTEDEATATCLCGTVQLVFPTQGPGLVDRFLCHCADCRKISSSMFCSNFTVADSHLRHVRGKEDIKVFSQSRTIATGNDMANHFCGNCGTLLYRVSSGLPGMSILRIGTVDDFRLAETKLKPQVEQFVGTRAAWLTPLDGVMQMERMHTQEDIDSLHK
ncbi:Putative CENP-V/GFA domain, Mss4-like superfamily protein [Colletotrichum destructivum]|uniref:CENP-V/GFA domain, Mss4-like superfamily protein n=1 Tax=Colletotrichum destructivum TaxID=34406 RepID=A0AAX4I0V2_9PEZI|nr:Putative CENP-V/GFA domain, Mss4-like superfamily protein [Colletotrichum destructivum]